MKSRWHFYDQHDVGAFGFLGVILALAATVVALFIGYGLYHLLWKFISER